MPYIKTPAIKKGPAKNTFYIFIKKNIKSIYVFLLIAVLLIGGVILKNKKTEPVQMPVGKQTADEKIIEKKPESYSRVTFFFTQPIKGSLAMPESWEGKYRMKDDGNTVNFLYIGNPAMVAGLFSISILTKEEWAGQNPQKGSVIFEQDGYVFIYKKVDTNPYDGEELNKYLKMMERADEIVKGFKGFKL